MPSSTNSRGLGIKSSKPVTPKTMTKISAVEGSKQSTAQQLKPANPPPSLSGLENVPASNIIAANKESPMENGAPSVNKKKQKRRQKQAARLAAEVPTPRNSNSPRDRSKEKDIAYQDKRKISEVRAGAQANGFDYGALNYDDPGQYEPAEGEDLYFTDDEGREYHDKDSLGVTRANGHGSDGHPAETGSKAKKKRKDTPESVLPNGYQSTRLLANNIPPLHRHAQPPPPPPPPLSTGGLHSTHHISKDRIWNTSTAEERERIKEFWLSLNEDDRRSLVKVEKEAVLKKMKEQQKHSCSCTVCGRKRTAIEEELEVLYDAYYEELEQYANNQHLSLEDGTPIIPHPRLYTHPMARVPPNRNAHALNGQRPSSGRIQELDEDDEGDDEDYSDEDEEDELSEEEPEELPPGPAADFFNFGNSLTVQGGILTVADDLLKNDGKKFIEMMEQLAERRMRREEDAQYASAGLGHPSTQSHNHGPPPEDDGYDDEEDEEYDSQDEEEYDDEELETLTEEQRMEEGRRMFQIFAARMFEQRVLTAYREKVASERQQKLIEELEEESRLDTQREAKKAKEAQKKKEKKRQQKLLKDQEKAKREAEKAAEEAEAKIILERKAEEQRQKKEEQRKRKEAEKKSQDEERQRKEAEKQKRLQEAREQQAEIERKQREQKEREKKKRAEARKKEREEREAKEIEAQQDKARLAAERKNQEVKAKSDHEAKERGRREAQEVKQQGQVASSPLKHVVPLALPTGSTLHPPQTGSTHPSPHLQIATPVIPKAPTPIRPRKASFQGSQNSSPKISQVPSGSSATSPSITSLPQNGTNPTMTKPSGQSSLQHPSAISTVSPLNTSPAMISQPPGFPGGPAMVGNSFSPNQGTMLPPMTPRTTMADPIIHAQLPLHSHQPQFSANHFRTFANPNGLPFPPGINGMRPLSHGRGALDLSSQVQPLSKPAVNINVGQYMSRDTMPTHSHSRHTSASLTSFDIPDIPTQTQPIARPNPIQRPSSVAPNQLSANNTSTNANVDDLSNHLGSSALLDDTDIPLSSNSNNVRRGSIALGVPLGTRHGFNTGGGKMDTFLRGMPSNNGNNWSSQPMSFGHPGVSSPPPWSPATGWSDFGVIGGPNRPSASRAVAIRQLVCQACNKLSINPPLSSRNGFHSVEVILRQVELLKAAHEGPIALRELLDICDTEGNSQNGGGTFTVESHEPNGLYVKFEPGQNRSIGARGAAGEIGSPITSFYTPGARMAQPPGGSVISPSGF